jgi:hypothetical protein
MTGHFPFPKISEPSDLEKAVAGILGLPFYLTPIFDFIKQEH